MIATEMDFSLTEKYFNLTSNDVGGALIACPAEELLHGVRMDELLRIGKEQLSAFGLDLPASFLGLAVYGLCGSTQIHMAQSQVIPDLSLGNLTFHIKVDNGYPTVLFRMNSVRGEALPEEPEARERAVIRAFEKLTEQTLRPLAEAIAWRAGVKPSLIWNQFGSRAAFLKDYMPGHDSRCFVMEAFNRDDAALKTISAEWFGLRRNPFDFEPEYFDHPSHPDKPVMVRSGCCFYYRKEGGVKCYSCPALTEADRAKLLSS
ncbi:hypothetical protein SY83_12490 [Paenibacillus swuensis]|uniref:Ferric siderophore reductase C-terminal domain-containing protein n=1 Tax=Paenibacillus swuensis TaxID=1178515 RepID=A0A172TIU7_9BACL|nr:(2Fe-2S)-binding protein [Paenibacillus swuensis]ANE46958.1 hypothetical protein SY83_12490 [Paenibacillus swuensis]